MTGNDDYHDPVLLPGAGDFRHGPVTAAGRAGRDELAELVQETRDDWQITFDDDLDAYIAVRRPKPTALRVLAALNVPDMRDKIRKIREEERARIREIRKSREGEAG